MELDSQLASSAVSSGRRAISWKRFKKQKTLHLFVWLGLIFLLIFSYTPMFGILMAFKKYSISDGIKGIFTSEWVGLKYFSEFVNDYQFARIVRNTLVLSFMKVIFTFPAPIILAILLNEVKGMALRMGVVDYLLKPVNKEEIAKLLAHVHQELPSEADSDCSGHAKRILAYTKTHYMNDLSLDHMGDLMDLHPSYISSLFKKVTGETFVNYLNAYRIKEAQKLLKTQRELPVNAIGQRVGFESNHYFTKVFKKYTGTTPGAYRDYDDAKKEDADP